MLSLRLAVHPNLVSEKETSTALTMRARSNAVQRSLTDHKFGSVNRMKVPQTRMSDNQVRAAALALPRGFLPTSLLTLLCGFSAYGGVDG